ncbi:hypothetical protein [Paenibacillus sp. V4I7]|uniref:hypothetical protein n=1 Tax=Paenibacillus sp. V4I7 TaxID=3042307 RepID=UPI0027850886|nr:hypothetical protein [Paenibacillus sp. V4I7]MDQ0897511.1 hypothetical protein [Paenibacillus sp. V4I7]
MNGHRRTTIAVWLLLKNIPHGISEWIQSFEISNYYRNRNKSNFNNFNKQFFPYDVHFFINNSTGTVEKDKMEQVINKVLYEEKFNPIYYEQ